MKLRGLHVRERLSLAVEDLATADKKLKERVLDAYENHLSNLMPREFPEQETRQAFEAIQAKVRAIKDRIEQKPGAYESLLRQGLRTPLQIAKHSLDCGVARELAKLITRLYFKVEAWVFDEYEREIDAFRTASRPGGSHENVR